VFQYLVRRIILMIPVAFIVCLMTFFIIHLVPGDPAHVLLGEEATPQTVAALKAQLGLDKPIPEQFAIWLWLLLHGDLGKSIIEHRPVLDAIVERLPVTFELGVSSFLLSLIIAVPLGIYSATHRNTWVDWLVNVFSLLGTAVPVFVLGLALIVLFAVNTHIFPPGGHVPFSEDPIGNLTDLVLPTITLAAGGVAANMRQIRASMIEALSQDYVRTAWAKGLHTSRIYYLHALRNAVIPVVTLIGFQVAAILGGAFVVEVIFIWPGIGLLAVTSVQAKDYPVIQATVLLAAFLYMFANLLVDVSYALLDPRIRFDKA
jgi:peptide/nickel transport system permease protein